MRSCVEHGVLDASEVEKAYVEPDGQITVVKRDDASKARACAR